MFAGIGGSYAEESNADQYISTYAVMDTIAPHQLALAPGHTNILKIPILWVQGLFDYNPFSYFTLNIILIISTCVLWSGALASVMNKKMVASFNYLLSGLLISSPELATNLSMATIRNIEYPIALIAIILLNKLILKPSEKILGVLSAILLTLLVASDSLFLYVLCPALFISSALYSYRYKLQIYSVFITIAAGAVGGLTLKTLLELTGLYILSPSSPTVFISYESILPAVMEIIRQLFQLMGANIFGETIKLTRVGLLIYFILTLITFYVFFVKSRKEILSITPRYITLSLVVVTIVLIGAYLASSSVAPASYLPLHYGNIRYITLVSFVTPTLVIFWLFNSKYKKYAYALSLMVFLVGIINIPHSVRTYEQRHVLFYEDRTTYLEQIKNQLEENDVEVVLSTFTYSSPLTFMSGGKIKAYPIINCNQPVHAVTNLAWYSASKHIKKTALIIDNTPRGWETWENCNQQTLEKIYGKPLKISEKVIRNEKPLKIQIYDYDIRSRLVPYRMVYGR